MAIGVFDNWYFKKMNIFLEWMTRIFFELNEILNWIRALVKTWIFFWIKWNSKMLKWIFSKNEWNFMIIEWIRFWMDITQKSIEWIETLPKLVSDVGSSCEIFLSKHWNCSFFVKSSFLWYYFAQFHVFNTFNLTKTTY